MCKDLGMERRNIDSLDPCAIRFKELIVCLCCLYLCVRVVVGSPCFPVLFVLVVLCSYTLRHLASQRPLMFVRGSPSARHSS